MAYIPRKGDIVRLNFDPVAGHEQAKQRPALVVSPQAVHETFGLCWVLPITTRVRGTAFEIPVTGGETSGVVLLRIEPRPSLDIRTPWGVFSRANFVAL